MPISGWRFNAWRTAELGWIRAYIISVLFISQCRLLNKFIRRYGICISHIIIHTNISEDRKPQIKTYLINLFNLYFACKWSFRYDLYISFKCVSTLINLIINRKHQPVGYVPFSCINKQSPERIIFDLLLNNIRNIIEPIYSYICRSKLVLF